MSETLISSPASTGGAGTFFEQHVAAYWIAQLLVRGVPPILINCVVRQVHFQTERLGWNTDDFLIECDCGGIATRKLVGQVKRALQVSAADDEFRKAVLDSWLDFNNIEQFDPTKDRFVLVTQRGTKMLLEHFAGLLDGARAARDGAEFEKRLQTKGFISGTAVRYCGEVQKIIGGIDATPKCAAEAWPFLRTLHVLSLDLDTSTRQNEAQIKTLLAYTAAEADAIATANTTWNELLTVASQALREARSLSRDDIPSELTRRHDTVSTSEHQVLRSAREHAQLIIRGIRSELGQAFHLPRAQLAQNVLSELETGQVVLLSGPAGCGKSAIAKNVAQLMADDQFVLALRAAELAQAHLDVTLQNAQIPTNARNLNAILAAQSKRLVLVESIERLLERPIRDAFGDLMTLVREDPGLRVLLTCRDYSTEQVRAGFLQSNKIKHTVIAVPLIDDAELAQIEAALPALAVPLKIPALRKLLRNPFFLDKALEIEWPNDESLPKSEREFRILFWRQIIRAEHRSTPGEARHREVVFQEVAVRRARALSAYVPCTDLDPAIIAVLRQDALLELPHGSLTLAATAHDVLEDWAIIHWMEEQNLITDGSLKALAACIGAHPAIRRGYRSWVSELIDRDAGAADQLLTAAITDTETAAQFRDDTFISFLKAGAAADFLTRHEARLAANDLFLLRRIIHLLRVACMKMPTWLGGTTDTEVTVSVPDGPAWALVLGLVDRNLSRFAPQDRLPLLGLIEDATSDISWWAPDIAGVEHVASIAHSLLAQWPYRSKLLTRTLQVIAKIPKADAARFKELLRAPTPRPRRRQDRDDVSEELQELVFAGIGGGPAGRDMPDLVLSVASTYLLASGNDRAEDRYAGSMLNLEKYFGIRDERAHEFFPPSALRGPWLALLRHHPDKGLDFILRLSNQSVRSYVRADWDMPLEPAWKIELTFADGSTRNQWGNPRLWNLYRGLSVGPYVLQSVLMALESWLLNYAKSYPRQVDSILVDMLRRSESACLAGVAASVSTAHPRLCGETLLVLLSAPDYLRFDLSRVVSEGQLQALSGALSSAIPRNKIYEAERSASNALPHRRNSLEQAIMELQLGQFAPRVCELLDQHKSKLPTIEQQDDDDRKWRLAIHRMDLRQTTISEIGIEDDGSQGDDGSPSSAQRLLRFDPLDPDPDIKEMVEKNAPRLNVLQERLRLFNWAYARFSGKETAQKDEAIWENLFPAAASDDPGKQDGTFDAIRGAAGIFAAVCTRDHWDSMSAPAAGLVRRSCLFGGYGLRR